MEHSPSWEANRFSASQEIPRILWEPKVHYRIHKCPPPVPILSQLDLVHKPKFHFLNIHLNINLASTPGSPKWPLSFRFSNQNSIYASPLPHSLYMPIGCNFSCYLQVLHQLLVTCRRDVWVKAVMFKTGVNKSRLAGRPGEQIYHVGDKYFCALGTELASYHSSGPH